MQMGNGAVFTVSCRSVHNYFYEFYIFMAGGPKLWMPLYYSTFFSASVQGVISGTLGIGGSVIMIPVFALLLGLT